MTAKQEFIIAGLCALYSAGIVAFALGAISIAPLVIEKKPITEIAAALLPIVAGYGWFGCWSIKYAGQKLRGKTK